MCPHLKFTGKIVETYGEKAISRKHVLLHDNANSHTGHQTQEPLENSSGKSKAIAYTPKSWHPMTISMF